MSKDTTQAHGSSSAQARHPANEASLGGCESFDRLKAGYLRFSTGQPQTNPARLREEIQDNAKGQRPFAIILACADSRVPPEIIFDQDVGDLFVVRVAGNVADANVLGSIQYAIEHLGTKLVVVLGHERCGAIQAALSVAAKKDSFSGPLGQLVSTIVPWVAPVYRRGCLANPPSADAAVLDEAVRVNVKRQVALIRDTLENLGEEKLTLAVWLREILVVGARYDLDDGAVEFFNEPADHRPKRIGLLTENGLGIAVNRADGVLFAREGHDFDDFEIHGAGMGLFALRCDGRFVRSTDGGVAADGIEGIHSPHSFRLLNAGNQRYAFQDFRGRYLSLGLDGRISTAADVRGSECFRVVEVDE